MMMDMQISEIALAMNARWSNDFDACIAGVSTDTRTLAQGELYVALQGENFDGHDFIAEAQHRGAGAAVISRPVETDLVTLQVADTQHALGALASAWRSRFTLPLIAITGSNGKTTVKEMTAAILRCRGEVLATAGNFNNEIGVPRTLFELDSQHDYAVVEMGASKAGDINYLSQMAQPTVALITNIGSAHLAGFGSLEKTARAKGEIFSGLGLNQKAQNQVGTAVIAYDDVFTELWMELISSRDCIRFGYSAQAEVSVDKAKISWIETQGAPGSKFCIKTPQGDRDIQLNLPGLHNISNAMAASAAALAVGADLDDIQQGLEAVKPVAGRLSMIQGRQGMKLIDDSYNANPQSLQAAFEVLDTWSGDKVLVLGDMAELGPGAEKLHADIAHMARSHKVAKIYALGQQSRKTVAAFGAGAQHFSTMANMLSALEEELCANDAGPFVVLVKGSRCMHMEDVVHLLRINQEAR